MPPSNSVPDTKRLRSGDRQQSPPVPRVTRPSGSARESAQLTPATTPQRPVTPSKKRKHEQKPPKRVSVREPSEEAEAAVEPEEPEEPVEPEVPEEAEQDVEHNVGPSNLRRVENPDNPDETLVYRATKGEYKRPELYSTRLYRDILKGIDMDDDPTDKELGMFIQQLRIADNWKPDYCLGSQELLDPENIPLAESTREFIMNLRKYVRSNYQPEDFLIMCNQDVSYFNSELHKTVDLGEPKSIYTATIADKKWLVKINEERRPSSNRVYLDERTFCRIIQRLEIETFKRLHDLILDNLHRVYLPAETDEAMNEAECDVCRVVECHTDDQMVFCDMCNTCVHMVCAGLLECPADEWKCHKCQFTGTPCPPCVLCPCLGGSMTYDEDMAMWAHHVCALYMPEIIFVNEEARAPHSEYHNIPFERFSQVCKVCDTSMGACITCSFPDCDETHHVGCALRAGLNVRITEVGDTEGNVLRITYCAKHSQEFDFDPLFKKEDKPWLARMESVFFLMTEYEKIAQMEKLEEIVVSDVYEYWKQYRLENGNQPMISNIGETVKITPTIERVAARTAAGLNPKLEMPRLPGHFFRRAALMVTEYRQHNLKRVRSSIQQDHQMLAMIVERETLKQQAAKEETKAWIAACEMAKKGMAMDVLKAWSTPADVISQAREPAVFKRILTDYGFSTPSTSQNHPKRPASRGHLEPIRKKVHRQHAVSPLRPRNTPDHRPPTRSQKHSESSSKPSTSRVASPPSPPPRPHSSQLRPRAPSTRIMIRNKAGRVVQPGSEQQQRLLPRRATTLLNPRSPIDFHTPLTPDSTSSEETSSSESLESSSTSSSEYEDEEDSD